MGWRSWDFLLWPGLNYWACVTRVDALSCTAPHSKNGRILPGVAAGFTKALSKQKAIQRGKNAGFQTFTIHTALCPELLNFNSFKNKLGWGPCQTLMG